MKNIFTKKKEENTTANYILVIIFAIAIIYAVILLIKNSFNKPTIYTTNNIKEYITEENLVKTDYFYNLDSQVANFLEAVDREMYFDLYKILLDKYNKIYSKNELTNILKEYKKNVFIYDKDKVIDYTGHVINAYNMANDTYLVQLDFSEGDFYIILGYGRDSYNFTIVE